MPMLDREEYIEQLYFFQTLRERIKASIATQEVLERIDQEILSTTKLPMAIQFLATEIKQSGLLSTGFKLLSHYFTPYPARLYSWIALNNWNSASDFLTTKENTPILISSSSCIIMALIGLPFT